jgi:hypothetical protein
MSMVNKKLRLYLYLKSEFTYCTKICREKNTIGGQQINLEAKLIPYFSLLTESYHIFQNTKMHTVHCIVYRLYFQRTNAHLEGIPVRQSVPLAGGSRSRPPAHPWSTHTTKLTTKTSVVGWCVFTSMVGWLHSDVVLVLKIITSAGNDDSQLLLSSQQRLYCCC